MSAKMHIGIIEMIPHALSILALHKHPKQLAISLDYKGCSALGYTLHENDILKIKNFLEEILADSQNEKTKND